MPYLCGLWRFANAYLEHKNEEIEAQCIQYVHRVYCKNTYLDMTDFLIETLTGYNEIQIF